FPAQKDAAQHEGKDALGMRLGIGERQRRAPGAAEGEPALDAEMTAQRLHVGDEMRGRVVDERAQRRRAPGAALIEDDDAVMMRVEEAAMGRRRAGAGAAMEKRHGNAAGIARLLPIHRVERVEPEEAGGKGLDRREEILAAHYGKSWCMRPAV